MWMIEDGVKHLRSDQYINRKLSILNCLPKNPSGLQLREKNNREKYVIEKPCSDLAAPKSGTERK